MKTLSKLVFRQKSLPEHDRSCKWTRLAWAHTPTLRATLVSVKRLLTSFPEETDSLQIPSRFSFQTVPLLQLKMLSSSYLVHQHTSPLFSFQFHNTLCTQQLSCWTPQKPLDMNLKSKTTGLWTLISLNRPIRITWSIALTLRSERSVSSTQVIPVVRCSH